MDDNADRDHVRTEVCSNDKRDDGVECDRGTNVDKSQEHGNNGRQANGIKRQMCSRLNLREIVSLRCTTRGKPIAYLLDPRASWETVVTSESPGDTRSSSKNCHSAENEENQKQSRQAGREPVGTQSFLEDFHKGESSRWGKGIFDAANAEQNCNKHAKTKKTIDKHTSHQSPGNGCSGLSDLLAHVDSTIST